MGLNPIWGSDFFCSFRLVGCISDVLKGDCVMQLWAILSVVIWLCRCVMQLESKTDLTLARHRVSSIQWLEHPNRSQRIVVSNPIWGSDFSEFPVGSTSDSFHIHIVLTFAHLGGWLAASLTCLKVTVWCSYELYCQSLFDSVGAWCSSSQRHRFSPCSPQSLQYSVVRASE